MTRRALGVIVLVSALWLSLLALASAAGPGAANASYPTTPPRADLITVGAPDAEGYASVHAAAGAVPPRARVVLVNLDARNLVVASADATGAFSARLFAPPGTSLLVKYDPTGEAIDLLWQRSQPGPTTGDFSYVNPLPGATIPVGVRPWGGGNAQAFQAVGGFQNETAHTWAGWWISGTLSVPAAGAGPGLPIRRGQQVRLQARLRVTSPALNGAVPVGWNPPYNVALQRVFGADGRTGQPEIWFNARLFTPTGLPIEREGWGDARGVMGGNLSRWSVVSAHTLEATLDLTLVVPADLEDGTYAVTFWFERDSLPLAPNTPYTIIWYHFDPIAKLAAARGFAGLAAHPLGAAGRPSGGRLSRGDLARGRRPVRPGAAHALPAAARQRAARGRAHRPAHRLPPGAWLELAFGLGPALPVPAATVPGAALG